MKFQKKHSTGVLDALLFHSLVNFELGLPGGMCPAKLKQRGT